MATEVYFERPYCLPAELDLSLHMTHATCNLESFCNNLIPYTIGNDQGMGDNRRSYRVFQHLGQDLN